MHILFTGITSFTGFWFAKELAENGHKIVAIVRKPLESYEATRKKRLEEVAAFADLKYGISYGSAEFFTLLESFNFDLFCHHAADVTDYKSIHFDPFSALKNNCGPIKEVLQSLKKRGCHKMVLTGSVFEQGEGAGSDNLRAVSPYGLSKGLTSATFKYYAEVENFSLGKFVIPNPFGPFEEFRFTSFLIKNWYEEKQVSVSHPDYVRDNIHVTLLAKAYRYFVETLSPQIGFTQINPSGYIESQGTFTERFAIEMRKRLNKPCKFVLAKQKDFLEPKARMNINPLDPNLLAWNEEKAWDSLASYYESLYSKSSL